MSNTRRETTTRRWVITWCFLSIFLSEDVTVPSDENQSFYWFTTGHTEEKEESEWCKTLCAYRISVNYKYKMKYQYYPISIF
jgi:hypothetical protein